MHSRYHISSLEHFIGRELGVSSWVSVPQDRIDAFAEVTGDRQWIHVDVRRAREEGAFGGTIAHGLLTLSLLPAMRAEIGVVPEGVGEVVNYGYDRVRFPAPVPAGARVRVRVELTAVRRRDDGRVLLSTTNTVEVEGGGRPALVAEALTLISPSD